jgi:photosystem II stability/assembly factor-like uncharacterized protein
MATATRIDMNTCLRTVAMGLSLLVLAAAPLSANAFRDRLDTPASPSALAPKGLLNGVARAGNRLVAVGERGHILWSDDQGQTWRQAEVPVSSDLTAVYFPTPLKGWAVGHDGVVLATNDGGQHWARQLDGRAAVQLMKTHYAAHPPAALAGDVAGDAAAQARFQEEIERLVSEGADKPLLDVWFQDDAVGYIVGLFNLIFRTDDGGQHWVPLFDRTDNPQRLHLYAVRPAGKHLYIAGEQGLVLKLDAASQRFQALPVDYRGTFFGIAPTGGDGLLVFGLRGNVFRSDDAGQHWQKVDTGIGVGITSAAQAPDGRLVLTSQAGHVLQSTDGGRSFTQALRAPRPIGSVVFATPKALMAAGPRGLQPLSLP